MANEVKICKQGIPMRATLLIVLSAAILLMSSKNDLAQNVKPMQGFMRQKLVYAQGILEGVTLEKFDLVLTNTAPLRNMSLTNAFLLLGNPDYMKRITNFQRSVDALNVAAKNQDLEAATKGYLALTESCVDCHRLFRREQF